MAETVWSGDAGLAYLQDAFSYLARRRWAGVGLALLVEAGLLLGLAYADAAAVVGIPAAVAAAIAGTVAVVFGPWDGAFVALFGAAVFVAAGGWGPGELAALGVWPAIVAAAGLFARRVSGQRTVLRRFVEAQELERRRLALELHDETAQTLAGALMTLRLAEQAATTAEAAAANAALRELLQQTIQRVRALAVQLRPKVLDDFGFAAAVERLGETFSERTGILVEVNAEAGTERLAGEIELALYRVVQEALANAAAQGGAHRVTIAYRRTPDAARIVVEDDGHSFDAGASNRAPLGLAGLRDRLGLLGGRLTVRSRAGGGTTVSAEIPVPGRE